jgi:acetolactate decarboxylase
LPPRTQLFTMMKYIHILFVILCSCCTVFAQEQATKDATVYAIGAMKNVRNGDLEATTAISKNDDIQYLYGLGPNDSLRGEITILEGKIYLSKVDEQGNPQVVIADAVKAPFFVLSEVEHWKSSLLQESVQHLSGIESYLQMSYQMYQAPFAFILEGKVAYLKYHIQNVPMDISEADTFDMHAHKKYYELKDVEVKILGFYSAQHKGVFTHHDTNIHLHFVTQDEKFSGHVDELTIGTNAIKLILPFKAGK